jgi:hypothetical protein
MRNSIRRVDYAMRFNSGVWFTSPTAEDEILLVPLRNLISWLSL